MKRSNAYRAIRSRVAAHLPSDGWSEDGMVFIVFDLHSTADQTAPAQVLFVLTAASDLLAARVVEPHETGVAVRDLLAEQAEL